VSHPHNEKSFVMFTNEPPHIGMSSLDEPHDSCMITLYGVIGPVFPVMHRDRLGAFTYEPDSLSTALKLAVSTRSGSIGCSMEWDFF
jgi:hypothetical protein